MPIVMQKEPTRARSIVHAALSRRMHRAGHVPSLRHAPKTASPLPLYRISAHGVSHGKPLTYAKRIGWQYLLIGGDCAGLANLLQTADGLKYGGLIEGAMPRHLLDAALAAENLLAEDGDIHEARLLHVPSLRLQALWLHVPRRKNLFIPLSEANNAGGSTPVDGIAALIRHAAARLKLHGSKRTKSKAAGR